MFKGFSLISPKNETENRVADSRRKQQINLIKVNKDEKT